MTERGDGAHRRAEHRRDVPVDSPAEVTTGDVPVVDGGAAEEQLEQKKHCNHPSRM